MRLLVTLSGIKYMYVLNKVYMLNNKQVSNYVVMPFFSSIVTFVLTGYGFMLPCMALRAFSITRPSTPADVARVLHGAEEPYR